MALLLHPNVAKKAQAEIDHAVGRDRLPKFGDWDALPYLHAAIKESSR